MRGGYASERADRPSPVSPKGDQCRSTRTPSARRPNRSYSTWTDRDTLLYALGVGAGIDDLAFTTENSHDIEQQVLPTYAVIACPACAAAAEVGTFNCAMLLHGSQQIRLLRAAAAGRAS